MTRTEYRDAVKADVIRLMRAQMDMSLTEGARASAHSTLRGILSEGIDVGWEMFDFS